MDLSERPHSSAPRHPWEIARNDFFASIVRGAMHPPPRRVLDVGAGDGWFARGLMSALPQRSEIVCWDIHYGHALIESLARESPSTVTYTADAPDGSFDLVMLMDVAEHVPDDGAFLRDIVDRFLAPEGWLLFSVPAWEQLFSHHDVALKHFRRYSPRSATTLLRSCGLRILRHGGLFHALIAPRAAQKIAELVRVRRATQQGHELQWRWGTASSSVVTGALRLDNALSGLFSRLGVEVPGTSWFAVCRRDAGP